MTISLPCEQLSRRRVFLVQLLPLLCGLCGYVSSLALSSPSHRVTLAQCLFTFFFFSLSSNRSAPHWVRSPGRWSQRSPGIPLSAKVPHACYDIPSGTTHTHTHLTHLHITPRYLRICFKTSLVRTNNSVPRTHFRPLQWHQPTNQRNGNVRNLARPQCGDTPLASAAIFLFRNGDRRKMVAARGACNSTFLVLFLKVLQVDFQPSVFFRCGAMPSSGRCPHKKRLCLVFSLEASWNWQFFALLNYWTNRDIDDERCVMLRLVGTLDKRERKHIVVYNLSYMKKIKTRDFTE